MHPTHYPYISKHIMARRYDEIDISNLQTDEDYSIDEEAFELLKHLNGSKRLDEILQNIADDKRQDAEEAIEFFAEEGILEFSEQKVKDQSKLNYSLVEVPEKNPFNPPFLKFMMINITEKCNLACKHCYITDRHQTDMPLVKLKQLIIDFYKNQGSKIILTGGEPFLYGELKELLEFLRDIPLKKILLTNGTLIQEKATLLDLIKENNFEVFVSVDGLEDTHNDFRNADCFKTTIEGIGLLLNKQITVSINTMVHKKNLDEFDGLSAYLKSLGNIRTWTVEVPTFDEATPKEVVETYEVSAEEGGTIMREYWWGESYDSSGVAIGSDSEDVETYKESEASYELEVEPKGYACGPFLMAVDVTGKVSKCGFFTEKSPGNIFEIGLKKSWEGIQQSSNWNIKDLKCKELNCEYLDECRGGCRYRAFIYNNDDRGIDPYKCIAYNKIHEKLSK